MNLKDNIKKIERGIGYKKDISDNSDFKELWELSINDKYPIEERNKHTYELAHLFWIICISYNGDVSEFCYINELSQFIDYINQNQMYYYDEMYLSKERMFISFLHELLHKYESINERPSDFKDFYNKIVDCLEKLKWLFALKKEDGKILFPIRSLIENVANSFKCDQEHYLQLVFSLEIFNRVELEDDNNVIKEKMLKIADEYNIELIRLLCCGGNVLYGKNAGINSSSNGTIIVKTENVVLIRNTSESYIEVNDEINKIYNGKKYFEGKDENDPIAYYYVYDVLENEKLENLKIILKEYPPACRLNVINSILKYKNYNSFLGECFWVDVNNKSFCRRLNPFSTMDENVIIDGRLEKGSDAFEKFINVMKNEYYEYGVISLLERNDIDVLTLDFVISIYDELIKEGNDYLDRMSYEAINNKDYLQNILFKIYIEDSFNNGNIVEALINYAEFVNKYFPYNSVSYVTNFSDYNRLIMPYDPFVPCNGKEFELYNALKEHNCICNVEIGIIKIEKKRTSTKIHLYDLNDKEILYNKITIMDVNAEEIDKEYVKDGYCLYTDSGENVYFVDKDRSSEVVIAKLLEFSRNSIVKTGARFPEFKKIHTVSMNIGFSDFDKNFNRKIIECTIEATKNISLYKLLWHIQVMELGLDNGRYELFRKLVLEYYYTEFVINYHDYIKQYFDELDEDSRKSKLIIAKESSGEVSTLYSLYIKSRNIDRGALAKAFDGAQINSDFKYSDNTYLGKEVDEIIFITDNILSGGSTLKMLDFYINNNKNTGDKRTYLWKKSRIVPRILAVNPKVKIVVKTIFSIPKGEEKIKTFFSKANIDIEIKHILTVPEDKYSFDKDVEKCIFELYETNVNPKEANKCIFRPCNMPADKILPAFVKDVSKLIGIFQRKEEV